MTVLFLAGFACAVAYTSSTGQVFTAYGERLAPALMWSIGRGMVEPDVSACPALHDFMARKVDSISPDAIPADLATADLNDFQREHIYLVYLAGITWYLFGPAWSSQYILAGLLTGAATAATYGLFRLGMARPVAVLGAFLCLIAPFHIAAIPGVRDYSKAPFILAVMMILGWLVKVPVSARKLLPAAIACGLLVGFGRGVRYDVDTCTPFFLLAIAAFLPGGIMRNLPAKIGAVLVFFVAIYLAGAGMRNYHSHRAAVPAHVITQGLMTPITTQLGIEQPFYEHGYMYGSDANAWSLVADYKHRRLHSDEPMPYVGEDHARTGMAYLTEIAMTFPADMLTRAFAAVNTVLNDVAFGRYYPPCTPGVHEVQQSPEGLRDSNGVLLEARTRAPAFVVRNSLIVVYQVRYAILGIFLGFGVPLVATALLVLTVQNIRIGLFALSMVLYFGGLLALQFELRHAFHLQFLSLWALLFLVERFIRLVFRKSGRESARTALRDFKGTARRLAVPAILAAAIVLGMYAPLRILRSVQERQVHNLLALYENAPLEVLPVLHSIPEHVRSQKDGIVRITFGNLGRPDRLPLTVTPGLVHAEYLLIELAVANSVPNESLTFDVVFGSTSPSNNTCSRRYRITHPGGSVGYKVFIPVLYYDANVSGYSSRLEGVDIPVESLPYIRNIYRLKEPENVPFLLTLVLPSDWQKWALHERVLTDTTRRRNWCIGRGSAACVWPR